MDKQQRRDFGDYLEDCKNSGDRGTRNDRGDFTWPELEEEAREFLAEESDDSWCWKGRLNTMLQSVDLLAIERESSDQQWSYVNTRDKTAA